MTIEAVKLAATGLPHELTQLLREVERLQTRVAIAATTGIGAIEEEANFYNCAEALKEASTALNEPIIRLAQAVGYAAAFADEWGDR